MLSIFQFLQKFPEVIFLPRQKKKQWLWLKNPPKVPKLIFFWSLHKNYKRNLFFMPLPLYLKSRWSFLCVGKDYPTLPLQFPNIHLLPWFLLFSHSLLPRKRELYLILLAEFRYMAVLIVVLSIWRFISKMPQFSDMLPKAAPGMPLTVLPATDEEDCMNAESFTRPLFQDSLRILISP